MSLFTLAFSGCYEDKGNYEYGDIKELKIEFPDFKLAVNYGDRVVVDPKFSIDIPEDAPYMSYRWSVKNNSSREGWDKRKLDWVADTIMGYNDLIFEAKDNRTGLVFTHSERLSVKSIFDAEGWVILSEIDGKSAMSFVKHKETDDNTGYLTEIDVFKNAYKTTNQEALGENPLDFQEHFSGEWGTIGQFVVFQDKPVDIDGLSFNKVIDLSATFKGGVLPAKIVNGAFMAFVDVLEDDKGQLYTRIKSTEDLFHSNYFLPKPIKYENKILTGCKVIRGRYGNSASTLIHDRNKQRFLLIHDGGIASEDLQFAGEIKSFPDKPAYGAIPEKYFPLNNTSSYDVINITYARSSDFDGAYRMIVREKDSGKYYYQFFELNRDYGETTFTFGNMNVVEIPGLNFEPDAVCMQTYEDHSKYIFISKMDKLYMYDLTYPQEALALYHDFGKDYTTPVKITSINGDMPKNSALHNERMGLGLDNGDFCIMRVEGAKNFTTTAEKIEIRLEKKDYLGRIIKIYRKIGDGAMGWN